MIVEALLSIVGGIIGAIAALIPDVPFPFSSELTTAAQWLGSKINTLDAFLPITEYLVFVRWVLTVYVPFVVVFISFRWIYKHVPVIGT